MEDYYLDFESVVQNAFPGVSSYPKWAYSFFLRGLEREEQKDKIFQLMAEGRSELEAAKIVIELEKSKLAFSQITGWPVAEPTSSLGNSSLTGSRQARPKLDTPQEQAAAIEDLTQKVGQLTLMMEGSDCWDNRSNQHRSNTWRNQRPSGYHNWRSRGQHQGLSPDTAPTEGAHFCDEIDNNAAPSAAHYLSAAFASDDQWGDLTDYSGWDWQNESATAGSEIYVQPASPVSLAFNAAPMDIDSPAAPPTDSRGRFAAAPFAIPQTTQQGGSSQTQVRPIIPPNARQTHSGPRQVNSSAGLQNIPNSVQNTRVAGQQRAAPRSQPANAAPFPVSYPSRPPARPSGATNISRSENSVASNRQDMAKKVRNAAYSTQVPLSVGQLMELSPAVRAEVLNHRSPGGTDRTNESHFVEALPDSAYHAETPETSQAAVFNVNPPQAPDFPVLSIARVAAKVNHVPRTCRVDTGCSGVMMGLGAVRGCQMIHCIDRAAGARRFRIANGQVETPLGLIIQVPITIGPVTTFVDVTVCKSDTDFILLGLTCLGRSMRRGSLTSRC